MRSSLSTSALVALCVGATVLPACAAPLSTSSGVDIQARQFTNLVWMNTDALPDSPNYPPDSTSYEDFLNSATEEDIFSSLQGTFYDLITYGTSYVGIPAIGQQPVGIENTLAGVDVLLQSETVFDLKSPAFTQWFTTAQQDPIDTSSNLATWTQNALRSANVIELCGQAYFNSDQPWGVILVQLLVNGATTDSSAVLQSKLGECLTANY